MQLINIYDFFINFYILKSSFHLNLTCQKYLMDMFHMESMWNLCGFHVDSMWNESMWNSCGFHVDSMWNESMWNSCEFHVDSMWNESMWISCGMNPCGFHVEWIHVDFMWNESMWIPCGMNHPHRIYVESTVVTTWFICQNIFHMKCGGW